MQVGVSLQSADAVVLVFSVEDETSFTEVTRLRDLIHSYKGKHLPAKQDFISIRCCLQRKYFVSSTLYKLFTQDPVFPW